MKAMKAMKAKSPMKKEVKAKAKSSSKDKDPIKSQPKTKTKEVAAETAEDDNHGEVAEDEEEEEEEPVVDDDASYLGLRQTEGLNSTSKNRLADIAAKMRALDDM